ncbi:Regucalcin, partial [Stegodyphus mimosarum]
MLVMEVRPVSQRLCDLGEGPHWDVNTQRLYYVDAFVGDVCRLDPATGVTESVHLDGITTFVIPYQSDPSNLLITVTKQVRKLNFATGEFKILGTVEPDKPKSRFNDGKCDAKGRLWTGSMILGEVGQGHLYKMDSSYNFIPFADNISLTNGITWSLNYDTMYYIDSEGKKIFVFDYDLGSGTASNQRVLFDYETKDFENLGVPDGMTTDIEGKLWVACYGGGCILRLDPIKKSILQKVDIPVKRVTSLCFGGPHFDILYVTTASHESTEEEKKSQPLAGAVFAVTGHGTRGQPACLFSN